MSARPNRALDGRFELVIQTPVIQKKGPLEKGHVWIMTNGCKTSFYVRPGCNFWSRSSLRLRETSM